jgi:mannan endo-1,4-beta-mannosidase
MMLKFILMMIISINSYAQFVQVKGTKFILENKDYTYLGTNFWYGMNLASKGVGGDRARLLRELDHLQKLGIKNLRIMAASEGPDTEPYRMVPALQPSPGKYNEDLLEGLDFLLVEMNKRKMKAIMCLNNFWNWSGGMGQYLVWAQAAKSIPYPPPHPAGSWSEYQTFTANFYANQTAQKYFQNHIKKIVTRINSITQKLYSEDATIMAWQLANEPRGDQQANVYIDWIDRTSKFIKNLDKNHLVTTGSEGDTPFASAGVNLLKDHQSSAIDYATFHIWVQNWEFYDPAKPETLKKALDFAKDYVKRHISAATKLNKPLVLEEFGISRDNNNHDPMSPTKIRDQYYDEIFKLVEDAIAVKNHPLRGVNFWAWAGEGRPSKIHGLWAKGDTFIGDPAHEHQGWYSVYDKDLSTINIIKSSAKKINSH